MTESVEMYHKPSLLLNDLKQCKKVDETYWTYEIQEKLNDQIVQRAIKFQTVFIQGYIDQKPCDDVMILRDQSGRVKLSNCTFATKKINSITRGVYCSVQGTLIREKGLPEISAFKITKHHCPVSDEELYNSWPVFVQDFKYFVLGLIKPNLNFSSP